MEEQPERQQTGKAVQKHGSKAVRTRAISTAVGIYLGSVIAGPTVIYRLVATERNWGEFWRVAAGPTGTMLAAAGVVLGAWLTLRNGESTRLQDRETSDQDRRSAAERDLRSRFTSAAEQLGDPRFNVRQAGAYAMAAIADDWLTLARDEPAGEREAQVCVDVLCGHLRNAPPELVANDKNVAPADQPVREVILNIIGSHVRFETELSWQNLRFDLTGAHLHEVSFGNCQFSGRLILTRAQFSGEHAIFTGSVFSRNAFDHSHFRSGITAEFARTHWDSPAAFDRVTFAGSGIFDHSHFNSGGSFKGASIGTAQRGATEVSFNSAKFDDDVDFTFMEVHCGLSFRLGTFNGRARFERLAADRQHGLVSFNGATFHQHADFEFCRFGSHADFRGAKFFATGRTPKALDDTNFDGEEAIWFRNAEFCMSAFAGVHFEREVSFYDADFEYEAPFPGSTFKAPVRFEKATFQHGANFVGAGFHCGANFYRVNYGTHPVDFTNPTAWNDVRVDWDGSSPYPSRIASQPPNVLPVDWPDS